MSKLPRAPIPEPIPHGFLTRTFTWSLVAGCEHFIPLFIGNIFQTTMEPVAERSLVSIRLFQSEDLLKIMPLQWMRYALTTNCLSDK